MKRILCLISMLVFVSMTLLACKKDTGDVNKTKVSLTPAPTKAETPDTVETGDTTDDQDTTVDQETQTQEAEPAVKESKVKDYFPMLSNVSYYYEGEGNEFAAYTVFADYQTDNRIQLRYNNGGTETVRVFEIKDGKLLKVFSRDECYYRENFLSKQEKAEILLKEPIRKGTEWVVSDNKKRYISAVDVKVETPSGNYNAVEVTTESPEDTIVDYYAPGAGLVRTVVKAAGLEVSSTLAKIEKDVPLKQMIRVYYPNVAKGKMFMENKEITFFTNDITRKKLEDLLKNIDQDKYDHILSKNTKIKSMYLNKDNVVYIDFTKELTGGMQAGSGYEEMILQCITNTAGNYYNVDKVYITVEGKPYESGHILMKKGEVFKVNQNGLE